MTIDEAITTEIEYSQPCDIICKDGADCNDCRSYHRQLAEWLEELKQYRQIGTVEECLRNKDFLDFLADKMNPNDFETYLSMYNSSGEKQEDERWEN